MFAIPCDARVKHTGPARTAALAALLLSALVSAAASPREAREAETTPDPLAAEIARLKAFLESHPASGLSAPAVDHTIGRLFLETAQALVTPGKDADPAGARAIADNVLPRYFAALEPAAPVAPRPKARATVTLVRWPYT